MRFPRIIAFALTTCLLLPIYLTETVGAQEPTPATSPVATDPKAAELRKQIQSYYDEMDRATERMNMTDAFKYVAPDCKFILRDGQKVNFKTIKETSQMIYRRSKKTQATTEITQFSTKGDTVTVEIRSVSLLRLRDDTGIESDLEATGQSRQFWMKTKAGWRIKQDRETDRTLKVNGQIIQE